MATIEDWQYIAGLIDGEGSIGLVKNRTQRRGQMTVSMTTPGVLYWAQSTFGGNLTGPYTPKNPKHSPTWTWRILAHNDLLRFLTQLTPLLRVKRDHAESVLAHLRAYPAPTTHPRVP